MILCGLILCGLGNPGIIGSGALPFVINEILSRFSIQRIILQCLIFTNGPGKPVRVAIEAAHTPPLAAKMGGIDIEFACAGGANDEHGESVNPVLKRQGWTHCLPDTGHLMVKAG